MKSITDLPLSSGARLVLYVDNNVLLLQQDVNLILQWFHDHGLTPNHSKTITSHQVKDCPCCSHLYWWLSTLPQENSEILRISNLSWSEHINSVCKTAKVHLGHVHRKLHQASPQVCHAIYCSTILLKLDYCCAVWDPRYSTDKTALNQVQRFASKVITHKWHANHSTLLNSLNWQPLNFTPNFNQPPVFSSVGDYDTLPQFISIAKCKQTSCAYKYIMW